MLKKIGSLVLAKRRLLSGLSEAAIAQPGFGVM